MQSSLIYDPLFIGLIVLSIVSIVLLVLVIRMHRKMKKFLVDVEAHNIADSLANVTDNLSDLKKFRSDIEKYLALVEKRLQSSVRAVHTIRFNPFHGTGDGGNQSFATTFLDETGNGTTISSLYSRDRMSVFAKPIKNFSSEHEMSGEERESLEKAKEKLGV